MKKSLRPLALVKVALHRHLGDIKQIAEACQMDKNLVIDLLEVLSLSDADQQRYLDGALGMKEIDLMTRDLRQAGQLC